MTAAYSNDLRLRVVRAIEEGSSRRAAANRFGVSNSTAIRWYQRWLKRGDVSADSVGGDRQSHHMEQHAKTILALVDEQADIAIEEIREHLGKQGHKVSYGAVWRLLDRHGYTRKKRQHMPANRTGKM